MGGVEYRRVGKGPSFHGRLSETVTLKLCAKDKCKKLR